MSNLPVHGTWRRHPEKEGKRRHPEKERKTYQQSENSKSTVHRFGHDGGRLTVQSSVTCLGVAHSQSPTVERPGKRGKLGLGKCESVVEWLRWKGTTIGKRKEERGKRNEESLSKAELMTGVGRGEWGVRISSLEIDGHFWCENDASKRRNSMI